MLERWFHKVLVSGAFLCGASPLGCVDPEGQYDEFREREAKTVKPEAGVPDGGGTCDPNADGGCASPPPGAMDGQWLFALSAKLKPASPILFFADVTTSDQGGATSMQWTLVALDAKARTPLPGFTPIQFDPSTIGADGAWSFDPPALAVPGAANPITGSDIEADVALEGQICDGRDFACGIVTGNVTKPIPLELCPAADDCSTWTLERLTTPDTLPETVKYNCACAVADPPPT